MRDPSKSLTINPNLSIHLFGKKPMFFQATCAGRAMQQKEWPQGFALLDIPLTESLAQGL